MALPRSWLVEIGNRFEIVRIRNFLDHDRGQVTRVDMEMTIRSTGKPSEHILLESSEFLPGLRMSDSSGEEYPLMSNRHLRMMLENAAAAGADRPGAARLLKDIDSRKTRLLWFRTPLHKALQPGEARVLHLTYEHPEKTGGILGAVKSLKTGAIMIKVPAAQPFPMFWILNKPTDYNVSRRRYSSIEDGATANVGSWADNAGAVCCRGTAKSESIRVKPDRGEAVLSYSLTPKKIVLALPVAAISMLSLLAILLGVSPHVGSGSPLWAVADAIVRHKMLLLVFIVTSSLVVPRFIDDAHLRNGLLWLYFVPVGLALCALVL